MPGKDPGRRQSALDPGARPRFAADVELMTLDDEAFAYSAGMQALFSLNATARFIWRACDAGRDIGEVIARTAAEFALDSEDARMFVESAIGDWRANGLLAGSPRQPGGRAGTRPEVLPPPGSPALGAIGPVFETRRYAVLATGFEIACETRDQADRLADALGHLEAAPHGEAPAGRAAVRLDLRTRDDAQDIYVDGRLAQSCDGLAGLAPMLNWLVFSLAVRDDAFLLQFHAAALGRGGRALLLPGPPASGKSTLAAMLARAGFDYLSDDSVVIERDGLMVRGLPFAVCVKETGDAALADHRSDLDAAREHRRPDGRRVRYLRPQNLDLAPHAAAWVAFLAFDPGAELGVDAIPPAEGLRRILGLAAAPRRLARGEAIALIDWARGLRFRELRFSDAAAAVGAIVEFCDG